MDENSIGKFYLSHTSHVNLIIITSRYTPQQETQMFPLPGVHIIKRTEDICSRRFCSISLGKLNPKSSGTYKCEISGDAPMFNVVFESRNMTVYGKLCSFSFDQLLKFANTYFFATVLPNREPTISKLEQQYDFGDYILANCTSDMSYPASSLAWYINDKKVSKPCLSLSRRMLIYSQLSQEY